MAGQYKVPLSMAVTVTITLRAEKDKETVATALRHVARDVFFDDEDGRQDPTGKLLRDVAFQFDGAR